ncbi:hypothetical protein C8Q74DRAFT_1257332 [Fomes fomentarius]|nr:hypothetical protein C8Q74DRAFT_1257332 [Fomes fomentarius]
MLCICLVGGLGAAVWISPVDLYTVFNNVLTSRNGYLEGASEAGLALHAKATSFSARTRVVPPIDAIPMISLRATHHTASPQ